jgi:selenide,water dikinase
VGNHSRDDAAAWDLGNGQALISTTDFFMPVVDDPFDFGRIAAANAISDVYAMGGTPVLAIAILGWPIDKLEPEIAGTVIAGGRDICRQAGIPLAGGHSIDAPEPIFGLAVSGTVPVEHLKRNNTAKAGDLLFLTKPLGIGIMTTGSKRGILEPADLQTAVDSMTSLNMAGSLFGPVKGIHALTDVTGFGLLGHLAEMAGGSRLSAVVDMHSVPVLPAVEKYLESGCIPGGTNRNWKSYGDQVLLTSDRSRLILSDPQTSGGLLAAVDPSEVDQFRAAAVRGGISASMLEPIGRLVEKGKFLISVNG